MTDIHSCSYYCDRPNCVKAQRDWFRGMYIEDSDSENRWRNTVIEQLIVTHIYQKEHDVNPTKALNDLINWHVSVALDPKVSSDAAALVEKGAERERTLQELTRTGQEIEGGK